MNGQSKIRPSEVSEPLVTSTIADFPELPVHPHTFLKAKQAEVRFAEYGTFNM